MPSPRLKRVFLHLLFQFLHSIFLYSPIFLTQQKKRYVVERFGKFLTIEDSGWFLGVPFVDKIAYIIDVRERALDIPPQSAITRDNVSVEVSGNLFVLFNDPQKAAYGAFNPLYSVMQVSLPMEKKCMIA